MTEPAAARTSPDPAGSSQVESTQLLATRGWASQLAASVVAVLIIQAATGLWIYLTPFSLSSQLQVLLHVFAGTVLLVPWFIYQVRHFLAWYRQTATAVMVLGYLLAVMVLACVVSGIVVTCQAALGPRMSPLWDFIHLVSGVAASILLAVHLLMAWLRRRPQAHRLPELRHAMRRFALRTALWCGSAAVFVAGATLLWPTRPMTFAPSADYALSSYVEQFEEYNGNPFAPSYARTEELKLIDSDLLSHSQSCGSSGCHEQILAEWEPSAHRFSAMNPPFQAVQKDFAADRGAAETRYCAGCHDPTSLFAGAKDIHNLSLSSPGMQEGCSCVSCHSISKVDQRGNADYVLTPPQKYLGESGEGFAKFVSDFLIRAYPQQHLDDYDRPLLRTPEFCGACHKQFIPEALNRFGMVQGQNQFDEWRKSHWHTDDPDTDLTCQDCHMRLVSNSTDPGRGEAGATRRSPEDGAHRHHGTIATNMLWPQMLKLPHWEEQVRLTEEWIRGETVIPEIAHLWPDGPVVSLDLIAPESARPDEEISIQAVVQNRKAGHNLSTGPLDFIRSWLHLRVLDAQGAVLAEWGGIDPETREILDTPGNIHRIGNSRKEGTLVLEALPINAQGEPIVKHELWTQAGGKGKRVIFPGHSDHQTYQFKVPAGTSGPLTVDAEFNFRRYRQEFLNLRLPDLEQETGFFQPTLRQASAQKVIKVSDAASSGGESGGQTPHGR